LLNCDQIHNHIRRITFNLLSIIFLYV